MIFRRRVMINYLAAHEAVAKHAGKSVVAAFGKSEKKISKWAVIGYPPSRGPEEI